MDVVKLGLIGAGWIARQHLEVLKDIDWIKVVGITSRTKVKAEQLAREYHVPVCSNDVESLIQDAKPDALMVLVSCEQMYTVVASVIPFGLPLFIEKPAGLLPEENEKLAVLAERYKVKTMVGFNRRFYSIFHKGLDIIKQHGPLLGVVVEGHERMWRIRAGGKFSKEEIDNWIFANSVHTIDLLRFFGGEVNNLKTIAQRRFDEARGDQFAAVMELENGAIGQYNAHWYSPGGWRVVLYGDGATVEFKPLEKGIWIDKNFVSHDILPDDVDIKYKPGFYRQMETFGKLVREGVQQWPCLDLGGSYKTMHLAEQISAPKI